MPRTSQFWIISQAVILPNHQFPNIILILNISITIPQNSKVSFHAQLPKTVTKHHLIRPNREPENPIFAMALPLDTVGSLRPTFIPRSTDGSCGQAPFAFALRGQSPSGPRKPLHASVTFWEAYAP
ncbi:hypothetical protein RND71_036842 [Anisodus tanguticus]|uniref:Uncharacterized protein n=1 Tax=Anisodus tanguticus TaxID=243964 RepID=A0AAE1UT40_9SOLA|nr:hypothetical protein RND71_036842 [Anisodus tanguticus]